MTAPDRPEACAGRDRVERGRRRLVEVERVLDELETEPAAHDRRPVLGARPALDREAGVDRRVRTCTISLRPSPGDRRGPSAAARPARGGRPQPRHRRPRSWDPARPPARTDAAGDRVRRVAVDAGAETGQHRDPGHRGVAGDGPDRQPEDVRLDPVPRPEPGVAARHAQLRRPGRRRGGAASSWSAIAKATPSRTARAIAAAPVAERQPGHRPAQVRIGPLAVAEHRQGDDAVRRRAATAPASASSRA